MTIIGNIINFATFDHNTIKDEIRKTSEKAENMAGKIGTIMFLLIEMLAWVLVTMSQRPLSTIAIILIFHYIVYEYVMTGKYENKENEKYNNDKKGN